MGGGERAAIATYERVLGRPVAVKSAAPGNPLLNLSLAAQAMAATFDSFDSPVEMSELARQYGVTPTPLASFVRQTTQP
jgi:hypothetical protein